jgi:hydroxymethylpyrimidine kinase/phosphomethylpyrimidine kinase
MNSSILIVAGTDPLGGAGLYAHARVAWQRGLLPLYVPSALVVQSSRGINSVHPIDAEITGKTLEIVLAERTPDAALLGLIACPRAIHITAERVRPLRSPVVIDPVLQGGTHDGLRFGDRPLLDAYLALLRSLGDRAVATPNTLELGALLDQPPATTVEELARQATMLTRATGCVTFAKGGHLAQPGVDLLVTGSAVAFFPPLDAPVPDVHGTGCRLAAEIACSLAEGHDLRDAVCSARTAFRDAILHDVHTVGPGRPQMSPRPVLRSNE